MPIQNVEIQQAMTGALNGAGSFTPSASSVRKRVAHRVGHHHPPRLDARHELLAQARVSGLAAHSSACSRTKPEARSALVEAARLRPLLGEAPGAAYMRCWRSSSRRFASSSTAMTSWSLLRKW